jgi:phosphonate transport system substrate-binding protein
MLHARTSQLAKLLMLSSLSACSWVLGFATLVLLVPQVMWAGALHIGSISMEPTAEIKKFLPLARYLAQQLQSEGIDDGKVIVADSIPRMAALLKEGKVDLYLDSPYPVVAVSRLAGSQLLLRRWKRGVGEYHAVLFARQESGVSQLEDLKGKMIALERPFSTTGYFLPKMVLAQKGLHVVPKREATDPVDPDEVGYVFSGSDESTMVWVMRHKAQAGAVDNHSFRREAREHLPTLRILYQTDALPRQIVSYRPTLSPLLVARIKAVLLQMDQLEEGKKVLHIFEETTKFDDIPEHAMDSLLQFKQFVETEARRQ